MNPPSSLRSYALVTLAVASWALNFHLAVPVLKFVPPLAGAAHEKPPLASTSPSNAAPPAA